MTIAPARGSGESGELDRRLGALSEAAELASGRLDDDAVDSARAVVAKAGARLGLGLEWTVVALAGPTGAGKSQLFNVLTETELAAVGRRRPTTSSGHAAIWGDGGEELLDWLEIARRHRLESGDLEGLVLLDLPDFDSVEMSHRLEVDRVVELVDLVLWVVEPQKYADAALHDRYLRRLSTHAAAMAVVLNQADLLAAAEVEAWRDDMRRLLAEDGLKGIPIAVVSARTGDGLAELRGLLQERVAAHEAALERLAADLAAAADGLGAGCDSGRPAGVGRDERQQLLAALEGAAGVQTVVQAVADAHRRRGALATGWPFARWVKRLRPDPLRRLRLPEQPQPATRTSLPPPSDVQRAQVDTAARRLADRAAEGLPPPWPRLVRDAAIAADDQVADRLDRAVAGTDLRVTPPRWWRLGGLVQWALAVATVTGALWLLALAVLSYLRVDDIVPVPEMEGIPLPTWLLIMGILTGIELSFILHLVNGVGARRRARRAGKALRAELEQVAEELVVAPVEQELEAHARLCAAVETARAARGAQGLRGAFRGSRRAR